MIAFSETFLLLQQEGYLIQSSLLSGLQHLRNARLDTKGEFYTALFQLSIGLERLMKATFVINYMRENQLETPSNRELREFGHGLVKLFDHLSSINVPSRQNPLKTIVSGSIERMILAVLDEFASGSRYYNLDKLVAISKSRDPLEEWNSVIERILVDDVRPSVKNRISHQSVVLGGILARSSFVLATDLQKRPLDTITAISLPQKHEIAARYAVNYTMNVIRALAEQLDDVCHLVLSGPDRNHSMAQPIPYMNEFFSFTYYSRSQILRKKKWP
jgi:hypothetical protein